MTSKFLRFSLVTAVFFAISALAQNSSAATPAGLPAPSPAASSASPTVSAPTIGSGTKVGTINIEQAIFGSNEGRRDFETLSKKLEPKQNELKGQNDELEGMKKQLNTQGDKLNEDARATLVKQIETKQKSLERSVQDAQEEAAKYLKQPFERKRNNV